jgi:phosphate:Na+ symporter
MYIQILKLCAGIGLFLFAMYLIEESLKNLSGRNFKLFLQRVTKNRFGAVAGGAVVTGVLQSSSMVSLMVLAFVGAGVFTMKNALAIILGANLGTTLDSWIVATLGFKTNIEVIAYPSVFIGGALLILFGKRKSIKYLSFFLFGFGLLFIGLSFMKTAMAAQLQFFDFSAYSNMPLAFFLLIGFFITLLVQSSSVTMALTLSAVHVGAIDFPSAAAIVLGSETGTTMKLLLSGIGGTAAKKRVVLGNLLFNIFLTLFAFTFIRQIVHLITTVFTITDPLIGLVTFSSLVNLMSILLFLPFLEPFTRFLEKFFKNVDASVAAFIGNANVSEPQTAVDLFKREATYFIHTSMLLNLELMEIDSKFLQDNPTFYEINERKKFMQKSAEEKYEFLKLLQGELQAFYLLLRPKLQDEELIELNGLVSAVRHSIYAAKSMKDNRSNIGNLRRSSKNIKFNFLSHLKTQTEVLYYFLHSYNMPAQHIDLYKLQQAYKDIENSYNRALSDFYKDPQTTQLDDLDLTTIINFNRELLSSNKAMLLAVKDLLLNEKQSIAFNEMQTI